MTLQILHIWNIGGAALIAKTMNRLFPDCHSTVIMRKIWDTWGLTTYGQLAGEGMLWNVGPIMFVAKALLFARRFDIIHVHALDKIVPWIKLVYPKKPVILQYHGTDIREQWRNPKKVKLWNKADALVVWTSDLLEGAPPNVICLANPVDTELFSPKGHQIKNDKAFHFSYYADEEATAIAKRMNLSLVIHDRDKEPIPHHKMPDVLSQYEYYVDVKRQSPSTPILSSLSRTALEALACGTKVVTWTGDVVANLQRQHKPDNAVETLWQVYRNVLDKYRSN